MKRITELIIFFTIVCFGSAGMAKENNMVTHTLSFDINKLNLKPTVVDEVSYTEINWEGMHNQGEPGSPSLPTHSFKFSVPCDAVNFSVDVIINGMTSLSLPSLPYPAQYPSLTSLEHDKPPFVHLISSTENRTSATWGEIIEVSNIGGFNKTVSITVNPILWNANAQTIEVATDMTINLSWHIDSEEAKKLIIPGFQQVIDNAIELTREIVVNPEDVEPNCSSLLKSRQLSQSAPEKEYIPYIIVTTKDLETSLERLAALRRLRGFQTKIFCIEDILSDSQFAEGDIISGLNDDAGKLRAFLKYAHTEYGTQYVLLAGEYPQIPGRWVTHINTDEKIDYISDQYFRDLTTNWYSPSSTNVDPENLPALYQEIVIGRILLKNPQELDNYLDKIIQYEFNVKDIDLSYLNNAFVMCGHDQEMHEAFDQISLKLYQSYFSNLEQLRISEEEIVYGQEAVETMKSNYWGFIDWRSHGHYGGIGTSKHPISGCYGINALDNDKAEFLEEKFNGLDTWANTNHPCWTLSMSCNLAEFGYNRTNYNFAHSFILGNNYGGVAFIGNTGPGIINTSDQLIQNMLDNLYITRSARHKHSYVADIFKSGMGSNIRSKIAKSSIGIFGDPLVSLWFKEPEKPLTHESIEYATVNGHSILGYGINYFDGNKIENGEDIITTFRLLETENYTLMNYRTDILPYIHPCRISGLTINENKYWFTGKLRFNSCNNEDAIKLTQNTKLTIEALEEVEMSGNITLGEGAQLKIKSYKPISFNNCKIKGSGNIVIDAAGSVEIGKGTSIPKGVSLTISKPEKK